MQIILTEEEYLKLKNQSVEDKKTYVKRIDVSIALQELASELQKFGIDSFAPNRWQDSLKRFMQKLE
jgi:hypothetical protein